MTDNTFSHLDYEGRVAISVQEQQNCHGMLDLLYKVRKDTNDAHLGKHVEIAIRGASEFWYELQQNEHNHDL
jgi:hypothetical protein